MTLDSVAGQTLDAEQFLELSRYTHEKLFDDALPAAISSNGQAEAALADLQRSRCVQ